MAEDPFAGFPSEPSRSPPEENFQAAWRKLVATPLGGLTPASTNVETTPDGWTAVSGVAPYAKQGATWRALLITATGHGGSGAAITERSSSAPACSGTRPGSESPAPRRR